MNPVLRFFELLIVLLLVIFGTHWALIRFFDPPADTQTTYYVDNLALTGRIQTIIDQNPHLDISVSAIDLQTGQAYDWGEQGSFGSASLGKLVTATALLDAIEQGKVSLRDPAGSKTVQTQLTNMIIESDNTAWHELNKIVGIDQLSAYATTSVGLASYRATDSVMTSHDLARLLEKLASGKLLNNEHTALLLSLMKDANMQAYIVAATPVGAQTYHKVGYLKDRLLEAAIIKKDGRSIVLVIFSKSKGNYDFSSGAGVFKAFTKAATTSFFAGNSQ